MTTESKNLVKTWLQELGLPAYKLTAKTVGFDGTYRPVVKIHDWTPDQRAEQLEKRARANKIILHFSGVGFIS